MILIKFCESIVLITGHFNVYAGKIALERVQTLVILLNLSVKFMSLHLDSREIYLLLLLLRLLLLSMIRWAGSAIVDTSEAIRWDNCWDVG